MFSHRDKDILFSKMNLPSVDEWNFSDVCDGSDVVGRRRVLRAEHRGHAHLKKLAGLSFGLETEI